LTVCTIVYIEHMQVAMHFSEVSMAPKLLSYLPICIYAFGTEKLLQRKC